MRTCTSYDTPILIESDELENYLIRQGWLPHPSYNEKELIFRYPQLDDYGQPVILVVPSRDNLVDWPTRLAEALEMLSVVENRSPKHIIWEILTTKCDILRTRIIGDDMSISLDLALQVIKGLRNLVASSASAEEDPQPYLKKIQPTGTEWAKRFRFAHTFQGSFGFVIESPQLKPDNEFEPAELDYSSSRQRNRDSHLARNIMERIAYGLYIVQSAIKERDYGRITSSFDRGLNANMCEALLELTKGHIFDIEYAFSWSLSLKPRRILQENKVIRLQNSNLHYLEKAAIDLQKVPPSPTIITGVIKTLQSNPDSVAETGKNKVRIAAENDQGKKVNVLITLEDEDYRTACNAHRDGRVVSIRGRLHKPGKYWELLDPHNFRVE